MEHRLPQATEELSRLQAIVRNSFVSEAGTAETLQRTLLNTPPKWFLFSGHADAIVDDMLTLGFTTGEGHLAPVPPAIIASMFGQCPQLELVFINGCRSMELGVAIHEAGVPAVVCWSTVVEDTAARVFSVNFFLALTSGGEAGESREARFRRAFDSAKRAVQMERAINGDLKFELRSPHADLTELPEGWTVAAGVPQLLIK